MKRLSFERSERTFGVLVRDTPSEQPEVVVGYFGKPGSVWATVGVASQVRKYREFGIASFGA